LMVSALPISALAPFAGSSILICVGAGVPPPHPLSASAQASADASARASKESVFNLFTLTFYAAPAAGAIFVKDGDRGAKFCAFILICHVVFMDNNPCYTIIDEDKNG